MKRILLYVLIFLALISPAAAASGSHSVVGDLTSFAQGFVALFDGDTRGFVTGVVDSLPLFGLFLIVFGLSFYLARYTIFKRAGEDKEMDKYSRWVAIGIALVGLAQQSLYNTVLGWSTTFLTVAFVLLVIFMSLIFINKIRSTHLNQITELHGATKQNLEARKELNTLKHEFNKDKRLQQTMERDVEKLARTLNHEEENVNDELQQIERIEDLLRQLQNVNNS